MSARHGHITIECDGPGCDEKYATLAFLVGAARAVVTSLGWITGKGQYKNDDFCSEGCEKRFKEVSNA